MIILYLKYFIYYFSILFNPYISSSFKFNINLNIDNANLFNYVNLLKHYNKYKYLINLFILYYIIFKFLIYLILSNQLYLLIIL